MYFEVMTSETPVIDGHSIHGTLSQLKRLAGIVRRELELAEEGQVVRIKEEYSSDAEYVLELHVRADGFDPASADPLLPPAR